jgi:hypothetical protein
VLWAELGRTGPVDLRVVSGKRPTSQITYFIFADGRHGLWSVGLPDQNLVFVVDDDATL